MNINETSRIMYQQAALRSFLRNDHIAQSFIEQTPNYNVESLEQLYLVSTCIKSKKMIIEFVKVATKQFFIAIRYKIPGFEYLNPENIETNVTDDELMLLINDATNIADTYTPTNKSIVFLVTKNIIFNLIGVNASTTLTSFLQKNHAYSSGQTITRLESIVSEKVPATPGNNNSTSSSTYESFSPISSTISKSVPTLSNNIINPYDSTDNATIKSNSSLTTSIPLMMPYVNTTASESINHKASAETSIVSTTTASLLLVKDVQSSVIASSVDISSIQNNNFHQEKKVKDSHVTSTQSNPPVSSHQLESSMVSHENDSMSSSQEIDGICDNVIEETGNSINIITTDLACSTKKKTMFFKNIENNTISDSNSIDYEGDYDSVVDDDFHIRGYEENGIYNKNDTVSLSSNTSHRDELLNTAVDNGGRVLNSITMMRKL
ncbi:OrNVorf18 [Microplitis demolitor]|nr:OrNVorf18 [Microplitis demolitor]